MKAPVWLGIVFAAAVSVGLSAAGQDPKGAPKKKGTPEKGDALTVKGCLEGSALRAIETSTPEDSNVISAQLTYHLKGDKKLLKQLREEHDGKVVHVSGILKSNLPQDGSIPGATVGKTKVTFGVATPSTQRGMPAAESPLPVLDVKSFEGYGTRCTR